MSSSTTAQALAHALAHSKKRQKGQGWKIPLALVDLTFVQARQLFSSSSSSSSAAGAGAGVVRTGNRNASGGGGVSSSPRRRRPNASVGVGVGSRRGAHAQVLDVKRVPSSTSTPSAPPLELRGGYLRPSGLYKKELRQRLTTMREEEEGEKKRRELELPRAAVLLRERVEALVERTRTSSNEVREENESVLVLALTFFIQFFELWFVVGTCLLTSVSRF